jgi:hypothetical protein
MTDEWFAPKAFAAAGRSFRASRLPDRQMSAGEMVKGGEVVRKPVATISKPFSQPAKPVSSQGIARY